MFSLFRFSLLSIILWSFNFSTAMAVESKEHHFSLYDFKSFIESLTPTQTLNLSRKIYHFTSHSNHTKTTNLYLQVQKILAEKVPSEYDRPVISLKLISGVNDSMGKRIGILGGMGPLSDAHLLNKIVRELENKNVNRGYLIHLYSLPPPRKALEQITGGVKYALRLRKFLKRDYQEYYLASNTAHLNLNVMKKIASSANIIDLTKLVAQRIKESELEGNIVILGTSGAWKKKLYPQLLNQVNVPNSMPIFSEQIILQSWIDKIKQDTFTSNDSLGLLDFVRSQTIRSNSKSILLACTEVPLGLGNSISLLEDEGFIVYDTEIIFSQVISTSLLEKLSD